MSIILIPNPQTSPSASISDYQKQNDLLKYLLNNINYPEIVIGSNIKQGCLLSVKGLLYFTNSDTAITGTPSKYVKITQSGDTLTCSASFVANLTGVIWNDTYNGYYDASNNLYIFNESIAIYDGLITDSKTILSNKYNSKYRISNSNNIIKQIQFSVNSYYNPNKSGNFPWILKPSASGDVKIQLIYMSSPGGTGLNIKIYKNNDIILDKNVDTTNSVQYQEILIEDCIDYDEFSFELQSNLYPISFALMGDYYVY
jgi:hypothetical protein